MKVSDDYFAGLFDGEGSVTLRLDKAGSMTLRVSIIMCSRDPVVAAYRRFGGEFVDGKSTTKSGSKIYKWQVHNAKAVECLRVLSDKCLNKKAACSAALVVAESMAKNNKKQPLSDAEKAVRLECLNVVLKSNSRGGKVTEMPAERINKFLSKRNFGCKKVALCDGREFESMSAAAKELGVTAGAVWHGVNGGYPVKGFKVYSA